MSTGTKYTLIGILVGMLLALSVSLLQAETCPCSSDWTGQTYSSENYEQYLSDQTVYLWGTGGIPVTISKMQFTFLAGLAGVLLSSITIASILRAIL